MNNLPPITSIFLNVTDSCCLSCRYCFVSQQPNFMTYEVAKDAADFVIKNAESINTTPFINFFGGEPTLCWDSIIVPLTNYIRKEYAKPFTLSMTTNGILLNEERLKFLTENDIGLLFSIDGDKETQDYNRPCNNGKSSFDALGDNIDLIAKYFPNVCFRSTIIPETCHNTFHNIMFARDHGYVNFFTIPDAFREWSDYSKRTLQLEMRKYSEYVIECFRNGSRPHIRFSEYDESFSKITKINSAILQDQFRCDGRCAATGKCGLGTNRGASVGYNGDVFACQEMVSPKESNKNKFYIGNIYTGVDDSLRIQLAESFDQNADRTGNCAHCRLNRICNGGCVANNFMITGDVNKMSPVFCWWQNILLDEAIYVSNVLGKESNPTFITYWRSTTNGRKR